MTLKIEYPSGCLEINVGVFFGTADKRQINKLLRLAKQYCSEEQQVSVSADIDEEIRVRTIALDICGKLEYEREQAIRPFFGLLPKRPLPPQERQLVKQRDKLRWSLEQIQEARWNG